MPFETPPAAAGGAGVAGAACTLDIGAEDCIAAGEGSGAIVPSVGAYVGAFVFVGAATKNT
jgi:hypothetical protein